MNIFSAGVSGRGDFGIENERVRGAVDLTLMREMFCAAAPTGQNSKARMAASTAKNEATRFEGMNSSPFRFWDSAWHPREAELENDEPVRCFSLR